MLMLLALAENTIVSATYLLWHDIPFQILTFLHPQIVRKQEVQKLIRNHCARDFRPVFVKK